VSNEPVVEPWWLDDNMAYSASHAQMEPAEVAVAFEELAEGLDLWPTYGKHARRVTDER
jgi:hypothetical protein